MQRSFKEEILDGGGVLPEVQELAHRRLSQTHSLLGNHAAILRALRCEAAATRRVLDIGCGHGGLLKKVRRKMGVEVLGVDLQPPESAAGEFPILKLNAVREPLPRADVAVSVCLVHHLRDEEFIEMIRNVGRACRRFVILDLVRHRLPLSIFTALAPLCLPRVNVLDGSQSIRRAYTPGEFRALIARAIAGTGGTFQHTVAPFWIRQMADIRY
ncbi:methyltransferase domain-containing protein [Paludibaculum fermentans]|uniref:Methyltransferase domain-containing protein n=1 Tax=Paludibaculum fermentans TaxID=1473598 RepID=A0A7S7SLT4_PALFE|nr:methyltransferase domain-containing protein [Paludibaculum fermentans]QOY90577.1 methyltransferase domain-containing protein [Paludibaculum fermentans]